MAAISFIDFIFPQFTSQSWQNGISIYRAGGVFSFQAYGELVSGRVKAGIGENFEVRLKLHSQGKCLQWMECTCQANRRRGEKCPHIAAFCIYLDQEKASLLARMNISAGASAEHLSSQNLKMQQSIAQAQETQNTPSVKTKIYSDAFRFENLLSPQYAQLVAIEKDKEDPWINVTVALNNAKKITYRFGVDEACRLLFNELYVDKVPKELMKLVKHKYVAKRVFFVKKQPDESIKIYKNISLFKDDKHTKDLSVNDFFPHFMGYAGCFIKGIGFVPFADNMTTPQLQRWEDCPNISRIEGDLIAKLIENNFENLKEIAEVVFDEHTQNIRVFEKITIPKLVLAKGQDGFLNIQADFFLQNRDDADNKSQKTKKNAWTIGGTILEILKARREAKNYLPTENGFIKISSEFDWLKDKVQPDGQLKLSTIDFIKFYENFAPESQVSGEVGVFEKIRSGLISRKDLLLPSLANSNLQLRPYQEEGVKWLWWLYSNNLGGLLADEMGLGKTHQAMALLNSAAQDDENKMSLIVCPTSVLEHWIDKMRQFIPDTNIVYYYGPARTKELEAQISKKKSILVTSYGIMLRDMHLLMNYEWNLVVLDEAHLIKNQGTRTYKAACKLRSKMRLCLTGTPLENNLMELKNLFDYIVPNYLGTNSEFKRKYLKQDVLPDPLVDSELHRLIYPFKLRRNKAEVLGDLPEKVEDTRYCYLNSQQKKLYSEVLSLKGTPLIQELQSNHLSIPYIHIFSLITLLKQICNDPGSLDPRYAQMGSGKLALFDDLLAEALENNNKVVVFTQYAKMVGRLSDRLKAKNISHVCLTGSTTNRGALVKEFQENSNIKVFLGSLLAGGMGIDLTSASVVIHFDRWWNAAKENQATDRIHRIGQTRNVQVFKLLTKGTLEERIDEIITRKRMLFEKFVEQDKEIFKDFSREDLLSLLQEPAAESEME